MTMADVYRGIVAEQETLVEALTGVGVRAVVDPRRVDISSTPCALVMVERAELTATLACAGVFDTDWVIHCLGGDTAGIDTVRQLSAMVAQILAGMEVGGVTIEPTTYRYDGGLDVPCFDIRWTAPADWLGLETVRHAAANEKG